MCWAQHSTKSHAGDPKCYVAQTQAKHEHDPSLGVCCSLLQSRDFALSMSIVSNGNNIAITSEKYCMTMACRNHCWNQGQFAPRQFDVLINMQLLNAISRRERANFFGIPKWNGFFKMTKIHVSLDSLDLRF